MSEQAAEFAFVSERDAASQLAVAAKAVGVGLHPLPYSRFDPDKSTWWLSPVSANPAYAAGKIVVERPTIVDDGSKLIGLHIEKGVGPSAAPFFEESAKGRRLLMQRDWTWHPFLRALRAGDIDQALGEAESQADGLPLTVEVVAGLQPPPSLEADERPIDPDGVDRVRYRVDGGTLRLVKRKSASRLSGLSDRETGQSIGDKIAAIKDLDWTWVEILIGVPFRPLDHGGVTAAEVWRRACAPWVRWLR